MEFTSSTALLKIMTKKDNYLSYRQYVKDDVLGNIQQDLLYAYGKYYNEFDVEEINTEEFTEWFFHGYKPELDETERDLYVKAFTEVFNSNSDVAEKIAVKFHEQLTKDEILNICENKFDIDVVKDLCDKHLEFVEKAVNKSIFLPMTQDSVFKTSNRAEGIRWRLDILNKATGGLVLGDFIVLGAYTEVGKTTFLASEIGYMARHLKDGCILWLNNEEPNDRVMRKIMAATIETSVANIEAYPAKALERYTEKTHGDVNRVRIADISGYSIGQVEALVKQVRPQLVVVDMADKVTLAKATDEVQRLRKLYYQYRRIAKTYCPTIVTSHSSAPRRDKDGNLVQNKWLTAADLDSSKVGKPSEADVIIMLSKDDNFPNSRYLNIAKNKLKEGDVKLKYAKKELHYNSEKSIYYIPTSIY